MPDQRGIDAQKAASSGQDGPKLFSAASTSTSGVSSGEGYGSAVRQNDNLNDVLKSYLRALIGVNVVLAGRISKLASSVTRAGVQANKLKQMDTQQRVSKYRLQPCQH